MACSIPQPTTEGVIRPVPTNVDCQFLVDHSTVKEVRRLTNRDGTRSQAIKLTFFSHRSYPAVLNWTTMSSWCMPMCHRSGDAPRATSWATLRHNAGAQCRCAHAAAVGANAWRVSQQTLLPQLRRPSLGSRLPRLPTTTFAPYRKQNPVWDLYPILGSP